MCKSFGWPSPEHRGPFRPRRARRPGRGVGRPAIGSIDRAHLGKWTAQCPARPSQNTGRVGSAGLFRPCGVSRLADATSIGRGRFLAGAGNPPRTLSRRPSQTASEHVRRLGGWPHGRQEPGDSSPDLLEGSAKLVMRGRRIRQWSGRKTRSIVLFPNINTDFAPCVVAFIRPAATPLTCAWTLRRHTDRGLDVLL